MSPDDRYDVSGLSEAQFEPGSVGLVLKNLLGISFTAELDVAEANALVAAVDRLVRLYDEEHRFTTGDICEFHRIWLGGIYIWAGEYRQVNVSKGDFMFAAAGRIPALMAEYERDVLSRCTPCKFATREEIVRALAEAHVELVLIHPFREGNGRISRVLSTLMALQAGLPLLEFSSIAGEKKESYFAAVRAGLGWTGTTSRWKEFSPRLSSGALRSLDWLAFRAERFCDGRDRCAGFYGSGARHIGNQHHPILLWGAQVRIGLD